MLSSTHVKHKGREIPRPKCHPKAFPRQGPFERIKDHFETASVFSRFMGEVLHCQIIFADNDRDVHTITSSDVLISIPPHTELWLELDHHSLQDLFNSGMPVPDGVESHPSKSLGDKHKIIQILYSEVH